MRYYNILGFDVSMQDIDAVKVVNCQQHLSCDI